MALIVAVMIALWRIAGRYGGPMPRWLSVAALVNGIVINDIPRGIGQMVLPALIATPIARLLFAAVSRVISRKPS